MSRRRHRAFKQPTNPTIPVWRYMDFAKFVSMLENHGLYFCRSDRLGDPWEAAIPRHWLDKAGLETELDVDERLKPNLVGTTIEMVKKMRPWTLINCWHMNEWESAAMWKLYCSGADGIAIKSRFDILDLCLPDDVYVGEVGYISYETDTIPFGNLFWPFMNKRKSFEHERELRAIVQDTTRAAEGREEPPQIGEWKQIDLAHLIDSVYVAPTAAEWIVEIVRDVLTRYGLRKEVHHSALDAEPY